MSGGKPMAAVHHPYSAALLQEYFSTKEQCFPFTTNQHKHQGQPNFIETSLTYLELNISASGYLFEHVNSTKRDILEHKKLNDIVYFHCNLRLHQFMPPFFSFLFTLLFFNLVLNGWTSKLMASLV
jgi:hypothetical protein